MFKQYARNAASLLDLGCGRGGDLSKWREAGVRNVLAMDLSADQLEDARRRENDGKGGGKGKGGGGKGGGGKGGGRGGKETVITWMQGSLLDANLEQSLLAQLPSQQQQAASDGADAVAIMFAVQFAFVSRERADCLIRTIATMLKPGGVFFGTAPDGAAITAAVGSARELHLTPPDHQFALLLRLLPREDGAVDSEYGQPLVFSLEDTVTSGTDMSGCIEFLCHRTALTELCVSHGLEMIELSSLSEAKVDRKLDEPLTEAETHVASLYYCFAFRKKKTANGSEADPPKQEDASASSAAPPATEEVPSVGVGVYFGSFDPIHENHIAVAQHAIEQYNMRSVYLVSNTDNPRKPFVSPLSERAALIDARLEQPDCANGIVRRFPVRERQALDWRGREEVCKQIERTVAEELQSQVHIYQLMGQDSFEDPGARLAFSNASTLSTMQGRTILLFPRTTTPSTIHVPPNLIRQGVRVEVARSYVDIVEQLSSTRLRTALAAAAASSEATDADTPVVGIHPSVWQAAVARGLYTPVAPSATTLHLCVIGPPGCGKTTICTELVRRLPSAIRHVSGGDFHRAAVEALGSRYGDSGKHLMQAKLPGMYHDELSRFIYGCHSSAHKLIAASGVAAEISDAKELNQLTILESGHLSALEQEPSTGSVAFDVVFEIVASEGTLRARLKGRGGREGDWYSEEERLKKYFKDGGVRKDQLASYKSARAKTDVVQLDGEKSANEMCDEIERRLIDAATAKGIANVVRPPPSPAKRDPVQRLVEAAIASVCKRAFYRHVALLTWESGKFDQVPMRLPPKPQRGGSNASNASISSFNPPSPRRFGSNSSLASSMSLSSVASEEPSQRGGKGGGKGGGGKGGGGRGGGEKGGGEGKGGGGRGKGGGGGGGRGDGGGERERDGKGGGGGGGGGKGGGRGGGGKGGKGGGEGKGGSGDGKGSGGGRGKGGASSRAESEGSWRR